MPRFLSQEWVDQVVTVLGRDPKLAEIELTLQQVVTGSDGDTPYWVRFDRGDVTGGTGKAPAPADVTLTYDAETAVALAKADLVAQAAFMQGKLKVTGNMGKLLQHQEAIAALGPAMASIDTEY